MPSTDLIRTPFGNELGAHSPKALARRLDAARVPAGLAAARLEGAANVSFAALAQVQALSQLEETIVESTPHAAPRAKAIVDGYTALAVMTLGALGGA